MRASLMDADQLNFHPLINTEITGFTLDDHLTAPGRCRRINYL
jgi:hypothetical protein